MERKQAAFELKAAEGGGFEGYASVFSVIDQGGDVVMPGAFARSLAERPAGKVKMLWQHDTAELIGVWDEVREDERGLFVKGRILDEVQRGKEAMALLKAGAIDSMSIGYRTRQAEAEKGGIRKLIEVDLYEVSLVTFPMLPAAMVTDVKAIATEREFERFLRDAGFSRKEAAAITSHGFKALIGQRDAATDEAGSEGLLALLEQLRQIKEQAYVRG